jgi:predicted acyl esterase
MHLATALALLLLARAAVAQDPFPPAGGFPFAVREYAPSTVLGTITWVDGVATALDVYYPLAVPPASGWPCVLLVHGGEGNRRIEPLRARGAVLAKAGYVCLAYDVRGDGVTTTLNPPGFDASEEARLRDMAEAFGRANGWAPPGVTVDQTRLAVTGESMGGRHAYRAAGWSGQPLPVPMGPWTHMPAIAAVAPRIAPLDFVGDAVRDGLLMNAEVAVGIWERGPADPYYALLLAEDWPGIAALLAAEPLRNFTPRVFASTVPMLITNCWDDAKHQLASTVDALASLSPLAPVHTYWTTNGHSAQDNDGEQRANDEAIRRWFDRFLKGRSNGVSLEPRHESGYAPPQAATHLDPGSDWAHALEPNWPPATATTRFFLRSNGGPQTLLANPPANVEPGPVVTNAAITAGYYIAAFCADNRNPNALVAAWALDNEAFTSQPLAAELEILGRARCSAVVDATAGDFQLTAALYAVAPGGSEKLITAGTHGLRGGAPGTHPVNVELDDTAFVLPAGYRLRLRLRNLPIHDCANHTFVRFVPCFVPGATTVRIAPATPAVLDLPTRARPHAFLTPRFTPVSVAAGALHTMQVYGGAARAGQYYLVLLSASGFGPGSVFAPELLPINLDFWTHAVASAPTGPFFPGFSGLLDAQGRATASVDLRALPFPPALLGMRWTAAVAGLDAGGYWGGGPAEFEFWP